jgi:hypothetical protein
MTTGLMTIFNSTAAGPPPICFLDPTRYSGLTHHITAAVAMLSITTPTAVNTAVICFIKDVYQ